jgi:hypothetical protein
MYIDICLHNDIIQKYLKGDFMSIGKKIIEELSAKGVLRTLYRFQGINSSYGNIELSDEDILFKCSTVYFSKNILHHRYFIHKKLCQQVNNVLESGLYVTKASLWNSETYNRIISAIENNHAVLQSESICIFITPMMSDLIRNNSVLQVKKCNYTQTIPEITDSSKYGGSYGISDEWLILLNDLTLFTNRVCLNYDDVLTYLYLKKLYYSRPNGCDTMAFMDRKTSTTIINQKVFSPHNKHSIVNSLENILDNGSYIKNSEFGKEPTKTIRQIVDEYTNLRTTILKCAENEYQKKYIYK